MEIARDSALGGVRARLRITVLCWLAVLAVPCVAQHKSDVAATTPAALTGEQAWSIIKKTDRAVQQLVILGIINALNPRGSVTLPNGAVMPLGVSKKQCDDLKTELSEAATAEDYSAAIERLVTLGLMQRDKADSELKGSAAWRKDAKAMHTRVAAACAEVLVLDLPAIC